jgi:pimeloyl-ACP methyl ester carboxylesterase
MNRQVLFIQGGGAGVHDEWDDKLVASLTSELGPDYNVLYPRMPNEGDPSYASWATALQSEIAALDENAVLVGHSLGGTFLINTLAEYLPGRELGAIVLAAAPFVGEGGWPSTDWAPQRELGSKLPGGVPIHVFLGLADDIVPASHADLYAQAIPQARLHLLPGRDHQLNNDLSEIATLIKSLPARA